MICTDMLGLEHVGQRENLQISHRQASEVTGFSRKFDNYIEKTKDNDSCEGFIKIDILLFQFIIRFF